MTYQKKENSEKVKEQRRKYYQKNKKKIRAKIKKWKKEMEAICYIFAIMGNKMELNINLLYISTGNQKNHLHK